MDEVYALGGACAVLSHLDVARLADGAPALDIARADVETRQYITFSLPEVALVKDLVDRAAAEAIAARAIATAQQWRAVIVGALNGEIGDLPTAERLADAVVRALGEHVQVEHGF